MMQIQVETLRHALSLLEPVVPKKTALPAAQFTLVGEGRAMATNLETAVALELPEAVPESFALPGKMVLSFLDMVPGQALASLSIETDGQVHIDVEDQSGRFKSIKPEDFPPCFPEFEPLHEAVVDGDAFTRHLKAVAPFAAGKDDSRPVLTAICLEMGDSPKMVAGNGFCLAWEDLPGKLPGQGNILIPATYGPLISHFWHKARGGVPAPAESAEGGLPSLALVQRFMCLGWTARHLRLNWGEVTMFLQLTQGTFPNWPGLVPKEFLAHVSFLAEDLYRALRGTGSMARQGSDVIRLEWADNQLRLTAKGDETGEITMQVPATTEGPGRIAFNLQRLMNYVQGKQGMVKLSVSRERSPGVFTYHGKGNHVLMPMFVQWDTPSPYPPEPPKLESVDPGPVADPVSAYIAEATTAAGAPHVGEIGDPDGPHDDPVFSEETPIEDPEADMAPPQPAPAPVDQPPTRAEAAKPRRGRKAKAQAAA